MEVSDLTRSNMLGHVALDLWTIMTLVHIRESTKLYSVSTSTHDDTLYTLHSSF